MGRTYTNPLSRVHFRDEDDVMEAEPVPQPPCKKRLSPSSPSGEAVMEDLQLPCGAKAASTAFQESVRLEVDVKTLYSLLPCVGSDEAERNGMCMGGMIRVEAKQLMMEPKKKTFCVLCDGSGSMGGQRYADMCIALEAAVQVLRETGRGETFNVAVIRFDSEASVIYGPGEIPSDAQLKEIIQKLRPAGGTDIAKALKVFQDKVSAPQLLKGEQVIGVLITDGDDYTLSSSVRNGARTTETTSKLGNVSGETLHFLAVSAGADIQLLNDLAGMCSTTCNRVATESIAEVMGSALALEKVEHIVKVTVEAAVPGEAPTELITQQCINIRYSKDDELAPTDVSITLPTLKEGEAALEVGIKLEVFEFGYVKPGVSAPIVTQEKKFTLKAAASEEEFLSAMKDPCLEYILHAAKRIKGGVDAKVAGLLSALNIDSAIAAVDEGIKRVKMYAALTSDQTAADALAITVGELEAQRVELETGRIERTRLDNIRDRAYSEAMTDRNSMSVYGRGQSNSQNAARTLSAVTARTLSSARNDSQDLRSFSNVSGFGDLRMNSMPSRSSTGVSNFGDMRLASTTSVVVEEPEIESQGSPTSGRY
jgi:hypothetical protein